LSFSAFVANYLRQSGSSTIIDIDGAGGSTMEIELTGVTMSALNANNFWL
jgi:hypothetical protein